MSRHSPELAHAVVESGAVDALVRCLEEFDPSVKESAAWAIGYIARHNAGNGWIFVVLIGSELAQAVVDAGAVPSLVLCVQEPELALKRISASALSDIAKHAPELAQVVVDAQAIPIMAPFVTSTVKSSSASNNHEHSNKDSLGLNDSKLKRQVLSCFSQVAKHTVELAETVVDGNIFPSVYHCLKDPRDPVVRRHAANLVCEIVKHSSQLSQLIVNSGGLAAIVDYISSNHGENGLPAIMALGYIAAFNETLSFAVILVKAVPVLAACLAPAPKQNAADAKLNEFVTAAACWSLGQLGRHSPDHAKHLTEFSVLSKLLAILRSQPDEEIEEASGTDLRLKVHVSSFCH